MMRKISRVISGASLPRLGSSEHQQLGLSHQRATDRQHLAFAARQVPAICVRRSRRRGKSA